MAAAQRAAATNGPGPDLGPGPDPGSGSGPDPPRETMMGVSFLPTKKIVTKRTYKKRKNESTT